LIIHKSGSVKAVPAYIVKAYRGRRGIAPFILTLRTRWIWVFNFVPWPTEPPHPPSKKPWHPLSVILGGPQNKSACPCWEMKNKCIKVPYSSKGKVHPRTVHKGPKGQ